MNERTIIKQGGVTLPLHARQVALPFLRAFGRLVLGFALLPALAPEAAAQYAFNATNWRVEAPWGFDISRITSPLADALFTLGNFQISWRNSDGAPTLAIYHVGDLKSPLFASLPRRSFILAGSGREVVVQNEGSAVIKDFPGLKACFRQSVEAFRLVAQENSLVISGKLSGRNCHLAYQLTLKPIGAERLAFDLGVAQDPSQGATPPPQVNRLVLRMASPAVERIYGFGEQYSALNMQGRAVPVFSQEQGHLRGLPPFSPLVNLRSYGTSGEWYTTYSPMPYFIGSLHRGMFLEDSAYALFDFMRKGEAEVRVWNNHMHGQFIHGATLLDQIEAFTAYSGRMPSLPDWIHRGAVVGMMGGSDRVRATYATLKKAGANISAFWLQDWVGTRHTPFGTRLWWNWELDETRYPDWHALTDELARDGISMMGYINPYLADPSSKPGIKVNHYQEALENGYLVHNSDGTIALIKQGGFDAAIVDITNPAARSWFKEIIRTQLLGNGMRGWMADFGEALPYRSRLFSGADSAIYHNLYPQQWGELNREVLRETGHEGDAVFFSRSGFTRSPGMATLFWCGDQLVSWDSYNGLQSGILGLLTAGLSGISLNHWDIGGYAGIDLAAAKGLPAFKIVRSKELLLRWMEITPFTALFRTHEGTIPEDYHQITSSPEAIAGFAFSSQVFAALFDYRRHLMQEAAQKGYPLVRHPMLHYPDDATLPTLRTQFMLGDVFMIAPVVAPHTTSRKLYLPAGSWVHLWSGRVFDQRPHGGWIRVAAPLGRPPVFFREDAAYGWQLYQKVKEIESAGKG